MLSSRCQDLFPDTGGASLTEVRRQLKQSIESEKLFGLKPFEVWINEDAEPLDHSENSWDVCLKQARDCDVLIVLYNGHAGWASAAGNIGICHAEYQEGLNASRSKVRLVELPICKPSNDLAQNVRNERFQALKQQESPFRGGTIPQDVPTLIKEVHKTLVDAVLAQSREGGKGSGKIRSDLGAALEWNRLDFAGRRQAMQTIANEALSQRPKAKTVETGVVLPISNTPVLVCVDAIPAAFTVAAAREPIGRPHLKDHLLIKTLQNRNVGPVHLIACHRTVTETQATNLLGFPDATIISSPFGVYVADEIQKMQFVFLANCRDPSQTRHAVQRFLDWLEQSGESIRLAERAQSRARIVKAIAQEQNKAS
jgi:hypothetical protein|tara:strand:+ start:978 stop:2084 length:1107 start_codon:yes stop_codon:yes gene_type:complete